MNEDKIPFVKTPITNMDLNSRELTIIHVSLILGLKGFACDELHAKHQNEDCVPYKKGFMDTLNLYVRIREKQNCLP